MKLEEKKRANHLEAKADSKSRQGGLRAPIGCSALKIGK